MSQRDMRPRRAPRTQSRLAGLAIRRMTGWSGRRLRWYRGHPYVTGFLLLMVVLFILGNTVAYAAGPFDPIGFGDLFTRPNLAAGYNPTLYEEIPSLLYYFDTDLGVTEVPEKVLNFIVSYLMFILSSIMHGAIVVVWVLTSFAGWTGLTNAITPGIAALSGEFAGWLLPSALAVGGLVAYWQRRNSGDTLGQIVWVIVSAAIALTMTYSAATWVGAVNGLRDVGTTAVATASAGAIKETETPFDGPTATYGGPVQDTNLRKIGDSVWRAYVVTPWCVAEFGSLAACNEWGYELLQQGDMDSRKKFLESKHGEMGESARDWVKGKSPADRLGIVTIGLLVGMCFAALIVALSVAAGFALASAMILLFVGSFFVMLWCIPGAPRRWGLAWLQTLIGFVLQSVLATLILTAVLSLTSAAFGLSDSYGWGIAATVALTLGFAAFGMRRTLNQILGFNTGGGGGAGLLGYMALRGGMKAMKGLGRGARRAVGGSKPNAGADAGGGPQGGRNGDGGSGPTGGRGNTRRYNQNRGRIWAQTMNQGDGTRSGTQRRPGGAPGHAERSGDTMPNAQTGRDAADPQGPVPPNRDENAASNTPTATRKATHKRATAARPHQPRTGNAQSDQAARQAPARPRNVTSSAPESTRRPTQTSTRGPAVPAAPAPAATQDGTPAPKPAGSAPKTKSPRMPDKQHVVRPRGVGSPRLRENPPPRRTQGPTRPKEGRWTKTKPQSTPQR